MQVFWKFSLVWVSRLQLQNLHSSSGLSLHLALHSSQLSTLPPLFQLPYSSESVSLKLTFSLGQGSTHSPAELRVDSGKQQLSSDPFASSPSIAQHFLVALCIFLEQHFSLSSPVSLPGAPQHSSLSSCFCLEQHLSASPPSVSSPVTTHALHSSSAFLVLRYSSGSLFHSSLSLQWIPFYQISTKYYINIMYTVFGKP